MAIIRSKVLGLYVLDTLQGITNPFVVGVGSSFDAAAADAVSNGASVGDKFIAVTTNDTYLGFATIGGSAGAYTGTEINGAFNLALAATNTSMDISNSVNEIVARDGQGGSETYIVSGAQSWGFSADGFLTDAAGDNAHDMWRSSSGSKYVIVRFDTDVTQSSRVYVGQGLIESFSLSGGFDDNVTYSVTVNGYGKLYSYVG
jgi:predicted secreted protein